MAPPGVDIDGWDWLPRAARESLAGLALIEHYDVGQRHEIAVAPPFRLPRRPKMTIFRPSGHTWLRR